MSELEIKLAKVHCHSNEIDTHCVPQNCFFFSNIFFEYEKKQSIITVNLIYKGCRIHQLYRGKTIHPKCVPRYDSKQFDGEALVMVLYEMWSTPLLPSLTGPPWPGVVATDRVLPMGQIELFDI